MINVGYNKNLVGNIMSGSIGIANEKVRKKEEALREGKRLHKVDIFLAFTQTIPTDMI